MGWKSSIKKVGKKVGSALKGAGKSFDNVVKRTGNAFTDSMKEGAHEIRDAGREARQGGIDLVDKAQKEYGQHQRTPTPEAPPTPPLPPTRMPTSSDEAAARRKSIADQLKRRGRASTILTEDSLGA